MTDGMIDYLPSVSTWCSNLIDQIAKTIHLLVWFLQFQLSLLQAPRAQNNTEPSLPVSEKNRRPIKTHPPSVPVAGLTGVDPGHLAIAHTPGSPTQGRHGLAVSAFSCPSNTIWRLSCRHSPFRTMFRAQSRFKGISHCSIAGVDKPIDDSANT